MGAGRPAEAAQPEPPGGQGASPRCRGLPDGQKYAETPPSPKSANNKAGFTLAYTARFQGRCPAGDMSSKRSCCPNRRKLNVLPSEHEPGATLCPTALGLVLYNFWLPEQTPGLKMKSYKHSNTLGILVANTSSQEPQATEGGAISAWQ
ncbi:uncharacterized protein LOC143693425 [Agelaius phoeniceus]|uniref:uncharacterized protein LOC143693425 n=1 Tax=Agelaius phoeniceus TaxID=39638 RepID=UPI004054D99E